jgi:hypothetical protein
LKLSHSKINGSHNLLYPGPGTAENFAAGAAGSGDEGSRSRAERNGSFFMVFKGI